MTEATKKLAEALHEHVVTISDGWLVRPVTEPSGLLSEFAVQIENGALLRVGVLQLVSETPGPRPKLTSSSVGAITNMVRGGLHAEDLATGMPTLPHGVTVHPFEVVDGQPQFRLELTESGEEYTVFVKKTRHRPSVGDPIPDGSVWQVHWSQGRTKPGDPRRVSYYTATSHSEACGLWATDPSRSDSDLLNNASLFSSPIVEPEPERRPMGEDFEKAATAELAHQRERYSLEHDAGHGPSQLLKMAMSYLREGKDVPAGALVLSARHVLQYEAEQAAVKAADPSTCENCGGETFHHTIDCFLGREKLAVVQLSEEDRALLYRIAENTSPMKFTLLPKIGDVVETNVAHLVETKPAEERVRERYNAGEYNGAPMPTFEEAVHAEMNTPAPGAEPLKRIEAGYDEALDRIHFGSQSYERMLTSDEVGELRDKIAMHVRDARASFSGTAVLDSVTRIMGALQR